MKVIKLIMAIESVTLHSIPFAFHHVSMPKNIFLFHALPVSLIAAERAN